MTPPRATYRLQFRQGMTFARAAGLAPYWRDLGISHLYASPVFSAVRDSTHGYDVIDPNELDPVLGGEQGFRAMVAALKAEGLGLVLDFVPNHMATSVESPWWCDVLRLGSKSAYAGYFDIDWARGPLTLPFLGEPFDAAVQSGALHLTRATNGYALRYHGSDYPLNADGNALIDQAMQGGARLEMLRANAKFLSALHETQPWRLLDWRTGAQDLTYRRFFEITGLVGLRVEDPAVFSDVHRKLFELMGDGLVDGIRLDHIDGLADPQTYLNCLRERVGQDVYIVVEKILESGEMLRPKWPVDGTTGYEFIGALGRPLTSQDQADALDRGYRAMTGDAMPYAEHAAQAKCEMVARNLVAECKMLVALALRACRAAWPEAGWEKAQIEAAVESLLASISVYRTYVAADGPAAVDKLLLAEAVARAASVSPAHRDAIKKIGTLLGLDIPANARDAALAFVRRFQQTTGAVMAKGVEDTAFYRFNRLIALNEVGGDPSQIGGTEDGWHTFMGTRLQETPHSLSATATHDTKRGEDARARLYTISEVPDLWCSLLSRWSGMIRAPAIDSQTKWLLFQSLLGIWPAETPKERPSLQLLADRLSGYAEKAIREAKRLSSWADPNLDFEARVHTYVDALFTEENASFRADFDDAVKPFIRAGAVNGLVQTLLKLTAPGVPDIYQGTEGWDLSLVDPDNRRPVDFDALAKAGIREASAPVFQLMTDWCNAAPKRHILRCGLEARRRNPSLFSHGAYEPLKATGPAAAHILAFARRKAGSYAVTIVPRCVLRHVTAEGPLTLEPRWLASTFVDLRSSKTRTLHNELTGELISAERLAASTILREMPVALLTA